VIDPHKHEGCSICRLYGDPATGWITVYRPEPSRADRERDARGRPRDTWRRPKIAAGGIRCPCWPHPETEGTRGFDLARWLAGWEANIAWHEWAIECAPELCRKGDQFNLDRQLRLVREVEARGC